MWLTKDISPSGSCQAIIPNLVLLPHNLSHLSVCPIINTLSDLYSILDTDQTALRDRLVFEVFNPLTLSLLAATFVVC